MAEDTADSLKREPFAVVIPTTGGCVFLRGLGAETSIHSICYNDGQTNNNLTEQYRKFIESYSKCWGNTGNQAYLIHIQGNINKGGSWHLAVFLAHMLLVKRRLEFWSTEDNPSVPQHILWASGVIDNPSELVLSVGSLAEKLKNSWELFTQWTESGSTVHICVPTSALQQISPEYIQEIEDNPKLKLHHFKTIQEFVLLLGLPLWPQADNNPVSNLIPSVAVPQQTQQQTQSPPQPPPQPSQQRWTLWLAGILLLIASVGYGLFFHDSTPKPAPEASTEPPQIEAKEVKEKPPLPSVEFNFLGAYSTEGKPCKYHHYRAHQAIAEKGGVWLINRRGLCAVLLQFNASEAVDIQKIMLHHHNMKRTLGGVDVPIAPQGTVELAIPKQSGQSVVYIEYSVAGQAMQQEFVLNIDRAKARFH